MEELAWSVVAHVHRYRDGSVDWFVSFFNGERTDLYDQGNDCRHLAAAVDQAEAAVREAFFVLMSQRALGAWQRDRR